MDRTIVVSSYDELVETVQVGRDTIEATYFKRSDISTLTDYKLTLWDEITFPFHRLKGMVKNIYWSIRYGFQRMFKGYDSVDVFDTFEKFTERYTKILTDYKKNHYGYPGDMTKEEWDGIVDEMLYHLHYMSEINVDDELCSYVSEDWIPTMETSGAIMDKHKEEFFKLFSKYFYNLWD